MGSWPCQADYSVCHPITAASQMQVTSPLYPLFASVTGVSLAAIKKTQQGWILTVEAYFTLFKVGMI